jgi:hypothetical protein
VDLFRQLRAGVLSVKILKRVLLTLLGLFLVVLLAVTGLIYWVVKNPQDAWQFAEKKFLPEDLKITWQAMDFQAHRIAGLNFDIDWKVAGLKITKTRPSLHIPVQELQVTASLFPRNHSKKLVLHNVHAAAPELIEIKLDKPEQKEPEKNFFQQAQSLVTKLEKLHLLAGIEKLDLEVAKFKFSSGGSKPLTASFSAQQVQDPEGLESIHFVSELSLALGKPLELKVDGELKLPNLGSESPFLNGTLRVHGAGIATEQNFQLLSHGEHTTIASSGQVDYTSDKKHTVLHPKLKITLTPKEAKTSLEANFAGLPGPLVKVEHFKFELQTPMEEDILWSEKPSTFAATAPVALFFIDKDMRKPLEVSCECKIPEVLKVDVKGRTWLANLLSSSPEQKPVVDSQILVESVHNKLLSVDVAAKVKIDKTGSQFALTPALDLEASINNFQGFRRFLDAKNILIPAPFNLLEGTVKLSSHDLVKTSDKDYILPATVTTALTSPRQVVNITTNTVVRMTADFKEMFVDVVAKIESLQLELPPLDPMRGKPRVTMDRRILKAPPEAKPKPSKFKVFLSVSVDTTQPAAIRLLSQYFKPYLPVTMSLHRSKEKDNTGFLQAEPFQIEYLRRKVQVEKMRIDLPETETQPIPVDARFKIQQTEYTVFIDVVGPINKPNIRLSSEPYLPESEIISVLLYDRVSKDLVGADAETAGNVQAAMADRAIGLFGLWAFAATPIKSFSYNPVTKVYSATVALTDDVTAGIGTNWEEATRLELRKRVSKSWMLTAAWVPATQAEDQKTNLVLQWEKRF